VREEHEVWHALMRRKGLAVTDLADQLGITQQHAHRLLTGRRPLESQRDEIDSVLALGAAGSGRPLFAIGELDDSGELELVPAGDTQPLFAARETAARVARELGDVSAHVCVVPVRPAHAWRTLVAFHAAWGAEPEVRKVFVVDGAATDDVAEAGILRQIRAGLDATLRSRAKAREPAFLQEVEARLSGYTDARLPQ
jgi:hypothetical protein